MIYNSTRRVFVRQLSGWMLALGAGCVFPLRALAGWTREAFDAKKASEALKHMGVIDLIESRAIQLKAPEVAENSAQVPLEITSSIPGTKSISVLVELNPNPLVGVFEFSNGALPFVSLRVKMNDSSIIRAVVLAEGRYYTAAKEVKVTVGGCGG